MKKSLKHGKQIIGYATEADAACSCGKHKCKCGGNCTCESDTIISEEFESDLELLLSSYDTEIFLGVYDGVFYIKDGKDGMWNEIAANTEEEAIEIYNNLVEAKKTTQNSELDEDEQFISNECNRIWESRQQKTNKKLI